MTPWQAFIERRNKNIGFITKASGFGEPIHADKAAALAIETQSWQDSIGKKPFHISDEYKIPLGHGTNLKMTEPRIKEAIDAFMNTPMTLVGRYENANMDLTPYINPETFWDDFKKVFKLIFNFWGLKGTINDK